MLSLPELQRRFAAALFDGDGAAIDAAIATGGIDPAAGLDVYRRQLHAVFHRSLALEFPVIERLVGRECFARLARDFQAAQPSRRGDLQHIGAGFASFLQGRFAGGRYEYLSALAALEWAYQEALHAADVPAFDVSALRGVAVSEYGQLRFALHPACRLIASPYPLLQIWRANQPESSATEIIDLASGAARVLVHRVAGIVQLQALQAAQYAWLAALANNLTLGEALDVAQSVAPDFDLGATLRHFVARGVLTAVMLPRPVGSHGDDAT